MIRFLWSTYSDRARTYEPCGIAASEASAERRVRRVFAGDAAIRGATIWKVNFTLSPDGQQFEWQPIDIGLIFARDGERGVVMLPRAHKPASPAERKHEDFTASSMAEEAS